MSSKTISPFHLIGRHKDDFASVLPSHVHAPVWIRVAQSAVQRDPKLIEAANASPNSLMIALLNAARLGLEPGTEEYYLTPRKKKGVPEILGIVGYQGIVELMYRAGAVDAVVAEVVYESDEFEYQPGVHEVPVHRINWDAKDRGKPRLVYAYARMASGATSRVVVMNRSDILKIKGSSAAANSEFSPWRTHEPDMWLKSGVRQLRKWVPTSAEYRDALRKDAEAVVRASNRPRTVAAVDMETGEVLDGDADVIDAEVLLPDEAEVAQ